MSNLENYRMILSERKDRLSALSGETPILPGLEFLCCGYDIGDAPIHARNLLYEIIDPDKCKFKERIANGKSYKIYDFASVHNVGGHTHKKSSIESTEINEYKESLSVGMKASFLSGSGELGYAITSETKLSVYESVVLIKDFIPFYSISVDPYGRAFRDSLSDSFLEKIEMYSNNQLNVDEFISLYGFYFTSNIVVGGCIDYFSQINKSDSSSKKDVKKSADMRYSAFISADIEAKKSVLEKTSNACTSETLFVVGGDEELLSLGNLNNSTYNKWKTSIENAPGLIDFGAGETGVIPVSRIVENEKLRNELHEEEENCLSRLFEFGGVDKSRKMMTYSITTYTTNIDFAGTNGEIFITLFGVDPNGEEVQHRIIHDDGRDNHEKGSIETINFRIPDLGDVYKIDVFNKGKDKHPPWHLNQIEIECLESGSASIFVFDCWIMDRKSVSRNKI